MYIVGLKGGRSSKEQMTETENLYPTRPQCETKYKMRVTELPLIIVGVPTIAAMSSVTALVSTPDYIMSKKPLTKIWINWILQGITWISFSKPYIFLFQRQYSIEISIILASSPGFAVTHAVPCSSKCFESICKAFAVLPHSYLCLYTRTHVCAMQSFAIYIKIYIKITKGNINDSITTSNSSVRNMYFNYIQINLLSPTNTHLLISPLITPYSPPLFSPFLSLSFPPSSPLYKAPRSYLK